MKIQFSLFPKFYKHLSLPELAAKVRQVGLQTTNLVIRDGYWVSPGRLAEETRETVRILKEEGLTVTFATAGVMPATLREHPDWLPALAQNGIRDVRMGHFSQAPGESVREGLVRARRQMEEMTRLCEAAGVRAIYQVHHHTLVPNSASAYELVRGLPSAYAGVMLDPGNQVHDGLENWIRAAGLLGEYLAAVGIKDVAVTQDSTALSSPHKGWNYDWVGVYQGVVNWDAVIQAVSRIGFEGTFVWMPFYHPDDPEAMTAVLAREVQYIQRVLERAAASSPEA